MELFDLVNYTSIQNVGTVFHIDLYDADSIEEKVLHERGGKVINVATMIVSINDCSHPSKLRVLENKLFGKTMVSLDSTPTDEQRRVCISELFSKDYKNQIKWIKR